VRVVHTGLDREAFATPPDRQAMRARFGLDPGATVVGTLGRIAPEKGHRHLIDAVARLLPAHPGLALLIAGTGSERAALEAQAATLGIAHAVRFVGFVADAAEAYAAMDVFALPSVLPEGLPTSSLEAQAAGLPVVASDIGGTADTIALGETGALVPPGDVPALAAALERLIADPGMRMRMGAAARVRIERDFALPTMIERIASIYREARAARA
jgi:glycosyltransferase involved in cell wall biosynthesis